MDKEIASWKTISTRVVIRNPFLSVEEQTRQEEGSGKLGDFVIVESPDWVNVVAMTEAGEVVLIRQFRQGVEAVSLEIPGGIIEKGEDARETALRELVEETGYEPSGDSEVRLLGKMRPNPAFLTNTCYIYLVTNVRPTGRTHFDENEEIHVYQVPLTDVRRFIREGKMDHSLIVASFFFYELYLDEATVR